MEEALKQATAAEKAQHQVLEAAFKQAQARNAGVDLARANFFTRFMTFATVAVSASVAAALTVFLGAHLTRVGSRIGDLVLTVGLILTFCAGFMAISFWSFYRDFDPLWWGPNALLMIVPVRMLPAYRPGEVPPGPQQQDKPA
mgnify:CR=1 FL=1